MKAIDQYFHVVLFIMLYEVILTFKSVGETLLYNHANENYQGVLLCMLLSLLSLWIKPLAST